MWNSDGRDRVGSDSQSSPNALPRATMFGCVSVIEVLLAFIFIILVVLVVLAALVLRDLRRPYVNIVLLNTVRNMSRDIRFIKEALWAVKDHEYPHLVERRKRDRCWGRGGSGESGGEDLQSTMSD